MLVNTNAIVLSSVKYAEADLIVNCFTESSGLKGYLLRNVLKSRKGKLRASYFQPLTLLEISAIHKNKGNLERIREARIRHPYKSLHTDVVKSAVVMFISEVLRSAIREEESNPLLFEYLEAAMIWLDEHDSIANFHILFLLRLTSFMGFYPETSQINLPWFNLQEGTFEARPGGNTSESGTRVEDLKTFLGMKFDNISGVKLTKERRSDVLDLLLLYYQLHLQGYKKPRSLPVLNQLFH